MPWNGQNGGRGGGAWGGGGQNPWNRGGNKGGGDGGGGGDGPIPPDLGNWMRQTKEKFGGSLPGGFGRRGVVLIALVAVLLWAATGFYKIDQNEKGLLMLFGRYHATVAPGPGFFWPSPIGTVIKSRVTEERTTEIGFSSYTATPDAFFSSSRKTASRPRDEGREGLMLTKDVNIVDVAFSVFWKVGEENNDVKNYEFNIKDPENTVRVAAESVMRDVVGQTILEKVLTTDRERIADDVRVNLQTLLNSYGAGVQVNRVQLLKVDPPQQVIDDFRDVQRAKTERESMNNVAKAQRNSIIPQAEGEAERLVQEATADKTRMVDLAKGEADRFLSVYKAYDKAKEVTIARMYIEAMEEILGKSSNIVIDPEARGGQGVVPYLPLPSLGGGKSLPAAPNTPATSSSTGGAQ